MAEPVTSISGLSSGIDFRALVDQVVRLERRPAVRLEAQAAADKRRVAAFGEVRAAFDALRAAGDRLRTGTAFDAVTTTTSGADGSGRALVSAAAAAGAAEGSYSLVVERLAAGQKTVGDRGVAATGALGLTGTFAVNGRNVEVVAADSLAQVRDKINAVTGQSGVRAALVVGGPADARLVLTSTGVGAPSAFAVTDVSGALAAGAFGLTGAPEQAAADARVVVDGVVAERPSNTLSDVLPGVTLTLGAADPARTATVTVARAPSVAADAAAAFVEAYNKARALVAQQRAPGAALAGDPLLRSLTGLMASAVLPPDTALADDLDTLADAGVSLQRDGTLRFDRARFDAAAAARPDELRRLFASRAEPLDDLAAGLVSPFSGLLDQRTSELTGRSARAEARVLDIDARLEKRRTALLAQYARLEASLGRLRAVGDSLTAQFQSLNRRQDG